MRWEMRQIPLRCLNIQRTMALRSKLRCVQGCPIVVGLVPGMILFEASTEHDTPFEQGTAM